MAEIVKGGSVLVSLDTVLVACLQQCSMSNSSDQLDVSCKNPEGNKSFEPGAKTTTFSMQGIMVRPETGDPTETQAVDLWNAWNDQTEHTFRIGDVKTGGQHWEGDGKILSFNYDAGNVGSLVTFTAEVTISGAVTTGVTA